MKQSKPPQEKILTRSPDPTKKGVHIAKDRYDFIHQTILKALKAKGPLSSAGLVEAVVEDINGNGGVDYSIGWYTMAVRLDMEVTGEVSYDRSAKKPMIVLRNGGK